jgi:hypothetical protein
VDNNWQYKKKKKKKKRLVIRSRNATRLICGETAAAAAAALRKALQGGLLSKHLGLLPLSTHAPVPRYAIWAPGWSKTQR